MNKAEQDSLKHEIELQLCRIDYAAYCVYVHQGRWILGRHLKLICKNIEDLISRKMKQNILIISMPPQHRQVSMRN